MRDHAFSEMAEDVRTLIQNTILNDIRGRMMKDMILLETIQSIQAPNRVFKLQFSRGEYNMVI